jgi:hypothetical protein
MWTRRAWASGVRSTGGGSGAPGARACRRGRPPARRGVRPRRAPRACRRAPRRPPPSAGPRTAPARSPAAVRRPGARAVAPYSPRPRAERPRRAPASGDAVRESAGESTCGGASVARERGDNSGRMSTRCACSCHGGFARAARPDTVGGVAGAVSSTGDLGRAVGAPAAPAPAAAPAHGARRPRPPHAGECHPVGAPHGGALARPARTVRPVVHGVESLPAVDSLRALGARARPAAARRRHRRPDRLGHALRRRHGSAGAPARGRRRGRAGQRGARTQPRRLLDQGAPARRGRGQAAGLRRLGGASATNRATSRRC